MAKKITKKIAKKTIRRLNKETILKQNQIDSVVLRKILTLINKGTWRGTMTDLGNSIKMDIAPNFLRRIINRISLGLKQSNVNILYRRTHTQKIIELYK